MGEPQLVRCPACGATNRVPLDKLQTRGQPVCGRCKRPLPIGAQDAAPVVDQLATELAGRIRVAKLNVDDNPVTAGRLDVRSIPMLLVFKGGREVDRIVGVQPKADIARRVERAIG